MFDNVASLLRYSSSSPFVQDNYSGSVEFRLVRFRYPTRPTVPVLRGLTLKVTPGKTLALVGTSGCGKSTTVSLVERFYEAVGGEVVSTRVSSVIASINQPEGGSTFQPSTPPAILMGCR